LRIGFWLVSQNETDHYEDLDLSGWIILKWILVKMLQYGLD
jgi:hypothetical protein